MGIWMNDNSSTFFNTSSSKSVWGSIWEGNGDLDEQQLINLFQHFVIKLRFGGKGMPCGGGGFAGGGPGRGMCGKGIGVRPGFSGG
eukprot:2716006-Rhodomonas_salina.1